MARLHPITLKTPPLSSTNQELLRHLVAAAKIIDTIFLKQAYSKNEQLQEELEASGDKETLERFRTHYGPFDRTQHQEPFIPGHEKPKGAAFYPDDLTKEEWDQWLAKHPKDKKAFLSPYTIIRREGKKLVAKPYHEQYRDAIERAASHLHAAAAATENESLRTFLEKRAQALLTDEYYESELAWMDLDSTIDVTIGPYEVYEDGLNGIKTAYEACIGIVDQEATTQLKQFENLSSILEERLPLSRKHRIPSKGPHSPIRIINLIYSAGDARAGIHFTAFNLPNDERVREAKGSKKVMLKNVAEAKYETCWQPITQRILDEETRKRCSFDAYFMHILLHEISHGIGPGIIRKDKKKTTVNEELKEAYPIIEEAKADLLGVHNAYVLAAAGIIDEDFARDILVTYIAGIFRSIRFGINEAHAGANMTVYNWLEERRCVRMSEGKLSIDSNKSKQAIEELTQLLLSIEAEGDYEGAKRIIASYNKMPRHVRAALERMQDIPIDIKPIFEGEEP